MPKKRPSVELSNPDIFAYALFRRDGAGQFVDVEDILQECWRLSPSRFGWRTKQFPSDRKGWHALSDLEAAYPDLMMKTANGLGRQLTAEGVRWVRDRLDVFNELGALKTRAPKTRRPSFRILSELEKQSWVRRFLDGERTEISKVGAADMLRCAPDSPKAVWRQRLATLRSAAADNERPDIMHLLDYIERQNLEWFREEQ